LTTYEDGHVQLLEFSKETIPQLNEMMEDLFCQYGVNIPWFLLDFEFPDYSQRPDWVSGYQFNLKWEPWTYTWLPWLNYLLGILFDEAHLPRWQMPDLSLESWNLFNEYISILYDNLQVHYAYNQTGTFTKDEVITGEDSAVTAYYKWKDNDGYIRVANKSAADYNSDEKIEGQTSGAIAYTALQSQYSVNYTPETLTKTHLQRYGDACASGGTCPDYIADQDDAWDEYVGGPTYDMWIYNDKIVACLRVRAVTDATACPTGWYNIRYYAHARKLCLKFDLTDAAANPTSAKLRLNMKGQAACEYVGNATLRVYQHDWGDTLDGTDYTGGTLEGEQEIDPALADYTWIEIPVATSRLNIGGMTKYKMSLKEIDDGDTIRDDNEERDTWPWGPLYLIFGHDTGGVQLRLTYFE